ncbi:hypothetical protein J6590_089977 [Homalodisca vitripennis]|nr:hypothetical protein J6590_089977 [Homalodisca vitripennis]
MSLSEHILPTPPDKSKEKESNPEEWKKTKDKRKSRNIQRNRVLVKGERSYNSDCENPKCLTKPGKSIKDLVLSAVTKGVRIKKAKLTDISKLLKNHFGDDWDQREDLQFFKSLMTENEGITEEEVPDVEEYCEGQQAQEDDFVV